MVDEISIETGWTPSANSARTRRWDDTAGRNDQKRWLIADVITHHEAFCWVLNAKYKRAFGNESRTDRFQMCAYAVAFDANLTGAKLRDADLSYTNLTGADLLKGGGD